eukprot:362270-Chlamydomonas_euryale.AAC.8
MGPSIPDPDDARCCFTALRFSRPPAESVALPVLPPASELPADFLWFSLVFSSWYSFLLMSACKTEGTQGAGHTGSWTHRELGTQGAGHTGSWAHRELGTSREKGCAGPGSAAQSKGRLGGTLGGRLDGFTKPTNGRVGEKTGESMDAIKQPHTATCIATATSPGPSPLRTAHRRDEACVAATWLRYRCGTTFYSRMHTLWEPPGCNIGVKTIPVYMNGFRV